AEAFEHARAFVEGELAQRRTADIAGVPEHRCEIDPAGAGGRYRGAIDCTGDFGQIPVACDPAVAFVIQKLQGFHRFTSWALALRGSGNPRNRQNSCWLAPSRGQDYFNPALP